MNWAYGPSFMQLNEAPTVFAAVAWLDQLCSQGVAYDTALAEVKSHILYTNHTLVQAVESHFNRGQFNEFVMPNIQSPEVKKRLGDMFIDDNLKLSSLAIEFARTKSGVSKLHAQKSSSNFTDFNGNQVQFEAVTNGISREWTLPDNMLYLHNIGVLDEFDLPTSRYETNLDRLDPVIMRQLKNQGRQAMNEVLNRRQDHHGNPVHIPEDTLVFNFKRRFVSYKRPDMIFHDPDRLAAILSAENAHLLIAGKPHPDDFWMQAELDDLLKLIDYHLYQGEPVLSTRCHYIQDYDDELGRALTFGADCAINVPEVGKEACGTSWMKDMSNFQLLISTPDGGVADSDPIACLVVSGDDEAVALYDRMIDAAGIIKDDEKYKVAIAQQFSKYLAVISGSRMMANYLGLYHRLVRPS